MSNDNVTTTKILTSESTVADLAALKSALPKADAEFYVKCLEANMTVDQAHRSWIDRLQAKNEAQFKEIELAKARKETPGVDALDHTARDPKNSGAIGGDASGDAIEQFDSAVREKVAHGATRERAVAAVTNESPELHKAFLLATNPGKRRHRLIDERFDDE